GSLSAVRGRLGVRGGLGVSLRGHFYFALTRRFATACSDGRLVASYAREGSMVSSPIALILALLACAVLAYDSAGVTSAGQQSPNSTSVASASFISAPASL